MATGRNRIVGLLLAMLALMSQLSLGAMVLPDAPTPAEQSFDAIAVMCLSGTPADHTPERHRHAVDHTLCPLCGAMVAAVLLGAAPVLPAPSTHAVAESSLPPPAHAPPPQPRRSDLPRGPPVLT